MNPFLKPPGAGRFCHSHHAEVASLKPEEADTLLAWCEETILTTGRARSVSELLAEKQKRYPTGDQEVREGRREARDVWQNTLDRLARMKKSVNYVPALAGIITETVEKVRLEVATQKGDSETIQDAKDGIFAQSIARLQTDWDAAPEEACLEFLQDLWPRLTPKGRADVLRFTPKDQIDATAMLQRIAELTEEIQALRAELRQWKPQVLHLQIVREDGKTFQRR